LDAEEGVLVRTCLCVPYQVPSPSGESFPVAICDKKSVSKATTTTKSAAKYHELIKHRQLLFGASTGGLGWKCSSSINNNRDGESSLFLAGFSAATLAADRGAIVVG
jgi:hypothetical protein